MDALIVGRELHRRIAQLIRARLSDSGVSAEILCQNEDPRQLIQRARGEFRTAIRVVVLLTGDDTSESQLWLEGARAAAEGIPAIIIGVPQLPASLLSSEFREALESIISRITDVLSGFLTAEAATENLRKSLFRPSHAEFRKLLSVAKHELEATSRRDDFGESQDILRAIEQEAIRAWETGDQTGWCRAHSHLGRLIERCRPCSSPAVADSPEIPPRLLARMLSEQVEVLRTELEICLTLAKQAGWTDSVDRLHDVRSQIEQLTIDLEQVAQSDPDRAWQQAQLGMRRLTSLHKAIAASGPRTAESPEEERKRLAEFMELRLKGDEEQGALQRTINESIEQAHDLFDKGDFHAARCVIRELPDSRGELQDRKQEWLRQIDAAEEQEALQRTIKESIEQAHDLFDKGDFHAARCVIRELPDSRGELQDFKQEWLRHIDDVEEQVALQRTINESIEQAQDLVNRGDFRAARRVIRKMPDSRGELQHLKQEWLRQIDLGAPRESRIGILGYLRRIIGLGPKKGDPFVPVPVDRVHFSVIAPPLMKPGSSYLVDIWAHLEEERAQVLERAREEAGSVGVRIKSKGPINVERGTILRVRLSVKDFSVAPSEETILWEGENGNASFKVTVEHTAAPGRKFGVARVYANGFQVANISFFIEVGSDSVTSERLQTKERRIQTAFASYASEDNDAVLIRVQAMHKALPGLDVFFARKDLKSGEKWQERLAQEIMSRDVMYLFWSSAARASQYVDWEWRYGLRERGIDFIDPFPLVPAEVAPPPEELAGALHFGDWELDYMHKSQAKP